MIVPCFPWVLYAAPSVVTFRFSFLRRLLASPSSPLLFLSLLCPSSLSLFLLWLLRCERCLYGVLGPPLLFRPVRDLEVVVPPTDVGLMFYTAVSSCAARPLFSRTDARLLVLLSVPEIAHFPFGVLVYLITAFVVLYSSLTPRVLWASRSTQFYAWDLGF